MWLLFRSMLSALPITQGFFVAEETRAESRVAHYSPGPTTVKSSELDNFLPSAVQMAPVTPQSVVAGRTISTSALEAGSTVIVQPMLLPFTCLCAFFTVPPTTVKA